MRARKVFGGLVAVGALIGGVVFAGTANADHTEPDESDGQQFVWPVSSWVAANDDYVCCKHHSGSADLAVDLFVPVYPARPGVVEYSGYANGSHGVRIRHETVDGETYYTGYGHLVTDALVEEGQQVDLDTPLGYLGRTGNANMSGPHIHFTISVGESYGDAEPMKIPDLEIGSWVESGDYIFGDYDWEHTGLTPIENVPARTFDVRVSEPDGLRVYETTSRPADEIMGELSVGDEVTVLETQDGQYRIDFEGEPGWIPRSGTLPVESTVFGVRVTADNAANIRRGPTESSDVIGRIAGSEYRYLTGYGKDGGWSRVMWPCNVRTNQITDNDADDEGKSLGGCPSRDDSEKATYFKYGWIGPAVHDRTEVFTARTRIEGLNVYGNTVVDGENRPDCPCNSDSKIGEVGKIRSLVTVEDTRNGWYRIDHDGQIGWIRGWYTAGRQ